MRRYKFLPHAGEHELRVDADPPIKNYVLLAQQALNADEKRDGLGRTRPAIESLTEQLWTWMGRRGDGRLELKLPGPRSPWELNDKCLKLRSALDRMSAQYPNVVAAVAAVGELLSANGVSIEWGYLNSGTHDSRREASLIVQLSARLSKLSLRSIKRLSRCETARGQNATRAAQG
ncbi:hypothetical protein [Rhodanobacter lindaniclasticus]